jgi:hypothetical protein
MRDNGYRGAIKVRRRTPPITFERPSPTSTQQSPTHIVAHAEHADYLENLSTNCLLLSLTSANVHPPPTSPMNIDIHQHSPDNIATINQPTIHLQNLSFHRRNIHAPQH